MIKKIKSINISIENKTTITVNDKKIDPESKRGKKIVEVTDVAFKDFNNTMDEFNKTMDKFSDL